MGRVFLAYGTRTTTVILFKYLVQNLLSSDKDCMAVEQNLRRAWVKWVRLMKFWGGRKQIGERQGYCVWRWCKR